MKADIKGKTIEINGKRYLVLSCTFRQPSARDAAGWALLLLNERGELDQHMVGVDGPIRVIVDMRPIAAGSYDDLRTRTAVAPPPPDPIGDAIAKNGGLIGRRQGVELFPHQVKAAELADREQPQEWSAPPADVARRRVQRDPSKPVTEITWAEYPNAMLQSCATGKLADAANAHAAKLVEQEEAEQLEGAYWVFDAARAGRTEWKGRPQSERDAFKMAVRRLLAVRIHGAGPVACAEAINEQVARLRPIDLSPAVEAAIADGGKVVQNAEAPLQIDRPKFLGSVAIGADGRCTCRGCDTCPLGRRGSEIRCAREELTAAGHNWHHDKPGTDNGATVGTTAIPSTFDERVPDARMLQIWEAAHHGHNAIGHPVELQAICEELNQHRRAATGHHNSQHMQSLREQLHASRQLANQATKDLAAARPEIGSLQRCRDSADEQVRIMSAKVERLEFEIALLTKHATPIPELPPGVYENNGQLWHAVDERHALVVPVPADDFLTRNIWARRLVAERNATREKVIALQRRIDAMTRTMGPAVSAVSGPQPSTGGTVGTVVDSRPVFTTGELPASATILDTPPPNGGYVSPYKRD